MAHGERFETQGKQAQPHPLQTRDKILRDAIKMVFRKRGRISDGQRISPRAESTSPGNLRIVQVGNPVLRQRARALSVAEIRSGEIQQLIAAMRTRMHEAPGVGLAAPQIGRSLQLAVIEDRKEYHKEVLEDQLRERERRPVPFHVIINPSVEVIGEETAEFFEGCLSLAGFTALVTRARAVRVECLDERGHEKVIEASGWYARILQHEIDHLDGALYIDRMQTRSFTSLENWSQFSKGKPIRLIKEELQLKPDRLIR
jgi:peptide deformylase